MNRPLRIGVDARELLGDSTGVGRYLGELLTRWTSRDDTEQRRFVLYTPERLTLTLPAGTAQTRVIGGGRGTWWEQTHLRRAVRDDSLDVFFAPAYTAPMGTGLPLALTIHDISFVAHPEWFRASEGLRRRWLTRRGASMASVIFTDSEFSRSELERYLRIDPARIQVIPPGTTAPRLSVKGPEPRREPLVLFVGSLFNRRRLPDLIAAFARATTALPQARLVIVGDNRTWPRQDLHGIARTEGVETRTEFLSYIPEDALASLYARASVFAFFSEYEGFGLTPLEAMSSGVPPVVLDTPVAREVYADAAFYVRPGDIEGAARLLERLLTDPGAARPVLECAPAVLSRVLLGGDSRADAVASGEDRTEMSVSIVIVSYNAREPLENCLSSLAAAPPATPHDITVVDNASTDDSVMVTRQRWPAVQVIVHQQNVGFARANNAGIRATAGNLILLLNSDTIVPPGAIDRLCERLMAVPAAAVAGPRLVDAAGRAELSFGPMISPLGELRQKATMALYARKVGPVVAWVERATQREHFVDWVSGACLLVHRGEAEAVGLLDERYFLYTEDVDFCAAMRARGRRILFTPSAQITHLRGRSRATVPDRMNLAYRRSQMAFYEKHHPRWAPVLPAYLRLKSEVPERGQTQV